MTMMSVITADAPGALLARMEQDLGAEPLPPFTDECIVVQSLGMDRWVRQQFARRQGCAASLELPFPAAFCRQLASTLQRDRRFATGDGISIDARFEEQALTWRVFALLQDPAFLARPVHQPLADFLVGATDAKRYGLARRLAGRFDEYRLYRPELLIAWEDAGAPDDASPDEAWQASLWRTLLGTERPAHFARWFMRTIEQLETIADAPAGLPARVSVFGVSTLPPLFVRLLRAVARFVPVRFYVLMPQDHGWEPARPRHPLFDRFGGSSRELLHLLLDGAPAPALTHLGAPVPAGVAPSLLRHLQQGVASGERTPYAMRPDDRSLSVHVCHSPLRELEVLRDQLLDAFAADPTLRPYDVLVMAPDVELYAPMAEAIFGRPVSRGAVRAGAAASEGLPVIPYRVADRTLARESAPAAALSTLLELVRSRLGAGEVLELLAQPLVRRAAGIAPPQMDQVTQWVEDAAIRWGHDALTREQWHGAPPFAENSWRTGLDRLLAGYAAGRIDGLVHDELPVAGDLIGDTDLLGAFVQWVGTLVAWLAALRHERGLAEWTVVLQQVLDWLVEADDADERAAIDRVRRRLERLTMPGADGPVAFDVVREWVVEALADEEMANGFLTGGLTLCAMKPMRAIPHRIIAVLGLDDRAYPRRLRRSAFDLIGAHPRIGDRDPRADDRQLVLDTLLSAGDRLLLSYVGRSQANNSEIAPSVVVTELLDLVDQVVEGPPRASRRLRVEHPLQPFSPAYFAGGDTRDGRLFSFDARLAQGVAAGAHRAPAPPFLPQLPEVPSLVRELRPGATTPQAPVDVTIDEIVETWINPAKVYCRRVLQLLVAGDVPVVDDVEPMAMTALQRTILQQRMVQRALEGRADPARERRLAVAAGDLPAGALGGYWFDRLRQEASPLLDQIGGVQFGDPLAVEITGLDWVVRGQLAWQLPHEQWRVRAGNLRNHDKAAAWVAHVVRCAAATPVATRVIARDETLVIPPLPDAPALLDLLVQGVRAALAAPLPYFLDAACEYRKKKAAGDPDPVIAARDKYAEQPGPFSTGGDGCNAYVQLLWRGRDPIRELPEAFCTLADGFWTRFDEVTA